jgi:phage I-like protein
MRSQLSSAPLFLASALAAVSGPRIQLFPAGEIQANVTDRKLHLDAAGAARLIAAAAARQTPYSIDYDHASVFAHETGARAPAAGWFHQLEWIEGEGLFAADVEWTEAASALIKSGEYKFISPAFRSDKSGAITRLINAGLTNTPDFDGMAPVTASGLTEDSPMDDDLRARLIWFLNVPITATNEELGAGLDALKAMLTGGNATETASGLALIQDLIDGRTAAQTEIASLASKVFDPEKFVEIASFAALQTELAGIKADVAGKEVDVLVASAVAAGKLNPRQEDLAKKLGRENRPMLEDLIATASAISALGRTQTGGATPAGADGTGEKTPVEIASAASAYMSEQAAAGKTITSAEAVRHVRAEQARKS